LEITSTSSVASHLLAAGHCTYVNLMTEKEWEDLGATHEEDLLYKAQEMRVNLKRGMLVGGKSPVVT
jgi:hypothetical protein